MSFLRKFLAVPEDSTVWPLPSESSSIAGEPVSMSDAFKQLETALGKMTLNMSVPSLEFQELSFIEDLDSRDRFIVHCEEEPPDKMAVYDRSVQAFAYGNFINYDSDKQQATYELYYHSIWSPADEDAEFMTTLRKSAINKYIISHRDDVPDWMYTV